MRQEYRNKLKAMRISMVKAELFAKRCPMFAEQILANMVTGEEEWYKFLHSYKSLRTYDGVHRGHYSSKTNRNISNCGEEYDEYLFTLYINTLVEYNSHANYGLEKIHETVPVFFYDAHNSTFYCTDEQIGALLEALDIWKITAMAQAKLDRRDVDIRELEEELAESQAKLDKLKE